MPILIDSTIKNGDANVVINIPIVLRFSELMNTTTTLAALSLSPSVTGNWAVGADDSIFYYSHTDTLATETPYSVAIQNTATDKNGNAMSSQTISFTTGIIKGGTPPTRLGNIPPSFDYSYNGLVKETEIDRLDRMDRINRESTLNEINQWLLVMGYTGTFSIIRNWAFGSKTLPIQLEIGLMPKSSSNQIPPPSGFTINPREMVGGLEIFDSGKPILVWEITPTETNNKMAFKIEISQNSNFSRPIIFSSQYNPEMFSVSLDGGTTYSPLTDWIQNGATHCKFECPFNIQEGQWHARASIFIKTVDRMTMGGETVTIPAIP